ACGAEGVVVADSGLINARACFRMEALELDIHGARGIQDSVGPIGMYGRAQKAVSKHARRERSHIPVMLLACRVRVLPEQEELIFDRSFRRIAAGVYAFQHAPQDLAGRSRQRGSILLEKIDQEESR